MTERGPGAAALGQRPRHRARIVVRARHHQVLGERLHVVGDVGRALRVALERQQIHEQRHRQGAHALLSERLHPLGQIGREIDRRHPLRAPAHAVERAAIRFGDVGLVVVRDEQLLHRRPQHLELSRASEIGLAQHAARHREHPALAILVGRDGIEDRREAVGRLALERERRRQQLRDLRVVEGGGHTLDDRDLIVGIFLRLHDLHDDLRIQLNRRVRDVAHDLGQSIGRHHRHNAFQVTEGGEDGRRLRRDHRRSVQGALGRHDGRRQVADVDRAAGDFEQPPLGEFVEDRRLAAGDRHHDGAPEVVAAGFRTIASCSRASSCS